MQNEELVIAIEKAVQAEEKYTELYEFAPVGYLTISKEGNISELNFAAARMLNKERLHLINKRFDFFVSVDTLTTFNDFIHNIKNRKLKQSEIVLQTEKKEPITVIINGNVLIDGQHILTLVDISERKKSELALIAKTEELDQSMSYYVDRELRMIELKREVNKLLELLGKEKKYNW